MFSSSSNSGTPFGGGGLSSGTGGNTGTNNSSSDSSSPSGQTFGGAGVIGVTIPSEKQALLVYKGQDHYNLWEFDFDPGQDAASNIPGAGNVNGSGGTSPLNGGGPTNGGLPGGGNGTQPVFPWSPNGNLPPEAPGPGQNGSPPGSPTSPNGNLPSAPQQ